MSPSRIARGISVSLVLLALLGSCGTTAIEESHVVQVRSVDPPKRINYFRITIKGDAALAKTNYRAGLYDAEALDAFLGEADAADQDAVDAVLERQRRVAVNELATAYYQALKENSSDLDSLQSRLFDAMKSAYTLAEEANQDGLSAPRRKHAIILSAVASEVENAIAAFAEEQETEKILMTQVAGSKREEYLATQEQAKDLQRRLVELAAIQSDVARLAGDTSPADYTDQCQRLLQRLAAIRAR